MAKPDKPTKLRPKDLQPGDSIRVTFTDMGILSIREGTFDHVARENIDLYYNTEGGVLFTGSQVNEVEIELLARDGNEPTGLGAIVRVPAAAWEAGRTGDDVFLVHVGDSAWVIAGIPTYTYAWTDIPAPTIVSEGWKP